MTLETLSPIFLLAVALLALGGAGPVQADASRASTAGTHPTEQELLALQESLRETEMAFAASVADKDRERFASFISEEAIFVAGAVLRGKQAILDGWEVFFREDAPRLTWEPDVVEIQGDGELGLTRGPYTLEQVGPDGKAVSQSGLFNSIWKRQPNGTWQVLFDTGCPPCQAQVPTGGDR